MEEFSSFTMLMWDMMPHTLESRCYMREDTRLHTCTLICTVREGENWSSSPYERKPWNLVAIQMVCKAKCCLHHHVTGSEGLKKCSSVPVKFRHWLCEKWQRLIAMGWGYIIHTHTSHIQTHTSHIQTHTYAHTLMCMDGCTHMYTHTYMHTPAHTHTHTHTYTAAGPVKKWTCLTSWVTRGHLRVQKCCVNQKLAPANEGADLQRQ